MHYICIRNQETRALSSAGSEHLVYTQRVGGSNPSAPTEEVRKNLFFHLSTFSREPNICKYPIYNFGSYIRFYCELLTPACKKVYLPFVIKWIRD